MNPIQQFLDSHRLVIKALEFVGLGVCVLEGTGIALLYILGPKHKFWVWAEKALEGPEKALKGSRKALEGFGVIVGALALGAIGFAILWALMSMRLRSLGALILIALVVIIFLLLKQRPK